MKEMVKSDVNLKKQGGPVYVLEDSNSNNGSSDSHSVGSSNRGGYMGQNRAVGSNKVGPSSLPGTGEGLVLPAIAPAANSSKLNTYF